MTTPRVLLVDAAGESAGALESRLAARGYAAERIPLGTAPPAAADTDLAVVLLNPERASEQTAAATELLRTFTDNDLATLVWGTWRELRLVGGPMVEWLNDDVSLDEVVGKVATLVQYAPLVRGLERELRHLQRLGEQLNRHFGELDQEMRLAGRLQRDFLPRSFPDAPALHFEALYRPASWVSGDMYDVFRIDEHHLGMFIADAMGHGVAAGLLTMFLRQALVAKRVDGTSYTILTPAEALANLHDCLLRQQLPSCQFVTAAYAILDTRNYRLRLARAGHPYPILVGRDGALRELVSSGCLLGLPDVTAEFDETERTLGAGEKLVFYTDGMEDVLIQPRTGDDERTLYTHELRSWSGLVAEELIHEVNEHLDRAAGSLNPADDVTMLVLEVLPTSA